MTMMSRGRSNMKTWRTLTKAQKVERWEHVVETLRGLTPHQRKKHWDMSDWAYETECGTVACAAGHCGLNPWFRRRGFKLDITPCNCGEPDCRITDLSDVEGFFGHAGSRIFYSGEGTVEQVLVRVREYIVELKAE
jgi:hypothetical protein